MKNILVFLLITSLSSCAIMTAQTKKPTNDGKAQKTRTIAQTANDLRISTGIHVDLYCLELYKPVNVEVKNGVVHYTGTVPSLKESFAALGVAWKQNGVKEVINDLKIEKKDSKSAK